MFFFDDISVSLLSIIFNNCLSILLDDTWVELENELFFERKTVVHNDKSDSEGKSSISFELNKFLAENEINAKTIFEMNNQIENYRSKLRLEENQNQELKQRHETELNAAKIRYENELEKQNKLMNIKYDNLMSESNDLHLFGNILFVFLFELPGYH